MRALMFYRNMSPFLNMNVGHVGWGFALNDGRFCCGATENVAGTPQVDAPNNASAWFKITSDFAALLHEMSQCHGASGNQFLSYKYVDLDNAQPDAALAQAKQNMACGYTLIGNNCLDQACNVLEAFGVPWQNGFGQPSWGMPWKQTNPQPNTWYSAWSVSGPVSLA